MRILFLLLVLLLKGVALQAQCLNLSDLLAIGAEPTALTAPQVVTNHLTFEWTFNGPNATSRDTFWTLAGPEGSALPTMRLQVRAQHPGQDMVLKTTQAACVRQLRSELKALKLAPQPVTCPSCEAVRYQGPDFEATLYSQMKGDYPFIAVVHQVPAATVAAQPGVGASHAPVVAVLDIAAAAKALADPQATVLDVRTPEEFAAGHLQRAQNVNFRDPNFSQMLSKLNPGGSYVLYCASGNRSGQAAALMQQKGIVKVVNAGGYSQLVAAGVK